VRCKNVDAEELIPGF